MLKKLLELFFPVICVGCEREGKYLCKECKKSLQAHPELCPICHRKSPSGNLCFGCKQELPGIQGISIAFVYEKLIKKLILDLKFHHRYQTGQYLGKKLSLLIACEPFFDPNTTLVTHIPSHRWRRYIQKGYNQSQILGATIAQELGVLHLALTTKNQHTRSQIKLSRNKRKINLCNIFTYNSKAVIPDYIKTVLVIDDIVTTGSTLHEVSRIIKLKNPNLTIKGIVVARNAS